MKSTIGSLPGRRLCALLVLVLGARALAQSSPTASPSSTGSSPSAKPEEAVQLNVFEVRADTDNSYGALESNSLTAFRMDLSKMPATAQVFTRTFMDDVAATSIEEVLVGYAGTVTAATGNSASMINSSTTDRDGGQPSPSVRGAPADYMKRDGFTGPKPGARTNTGVTDNFSVERVEVIEGPQSILYGSVGGGGVINTVSKRAQFNSEKNSVSARLNQYGGKRVQTSTISSRSAIRGAAGMPASSRSRDSSITWATP